MYAKIRNIIACILTGVIIICLLTVTLTFGRFSKVEESGVEGSGDISFTVSNQMEVRTVEELFVAIANGYSYVKVADDMENPLVVTSAIVDVGSDLIIDLNGHDLQRNNREAMLNIKENVRVTVIDSSKAQTGSLYNPVGSVLQIGGGTLTVSSGKFESGPRTTEYLGYVASSGQYPTHGTVSGKFEGSLFVKGTNGYKETENVNLPIITPTVTQTDIGKATYYANGNMYLQEGLSSDYDSARFGADTYLYYSIDDGSVGTDAIYSAGSADFYYKYYTEKTLGENSKPSYSGASATKKSDSWVAVTVYGYNKVIDAAKNNAGGFNATNKSNFAAIKMLEGSLQVCGGEYVSNFGVSSAYCVYASGGKMIVDDGTFYAIGEGVCVSCNYENDSDSLRITKGSFKSYRGDTIQLTAGTMIVTGGTFVKDSTAFTSSTAGDHNNAAINISNGIITLESTELTPINFYLAGRFMAAIHCGTGAKIYSTGVNYQFGTTDGTNEIPRETGGNNMGIYSQGGEVNVRSCVFIQPGDYSYGIYSLDNSASGSAQINVRSSIFSLGGKRCVGINANGGTINIGRQEDMLSQETIPVEDANTKDGYPIETYTMFYLDHVSNCYGIYVSDSSNATGATGEVTRLATRINVYAGQFIIGSGTDSNINDPKEKYYAISEQPGKTEPAYVEGKEYSPTELISEEKVWSAGVYLNQNGASVGLGRVRMVIGGDYSAGIFVENGEVTRLYNPEASGQVAGDITAPTTVLFVGTTLNGYKNGGYADKADKNETDRNKKWSYLYKRDSDYMQTEKFIEYYDRIVSCDSHYEYGIAAKGGNVDIGRIYINLRSFSSRGIFASGGNAAVDNFLANIDNQIWEENTVNGKTELVGTPPETLTTTTMTIRNGNVTINDADIRSNGIGILLNFGHLTFNGNIKIQSINTSPIYITSTIMASAEGTGNATNTWTINKDSKVNIECRLTAGKPFDDANQEFKYETEPQTWGKDETDPTEPIPWVLNQSEEAIKSYNGVNIKGGSLIGAGELTVDFTGLENKDQKNYDPYNMSLSSCAINVEQLDGYEAPEVKLWHVHVTSQVGGGMSVKGGNVLLGKDPAQFTDEQKAVLKTEAGEDCNKLVEIKTLGKERYKEILLGSYGNWNYYPSQTGGPGIKVADGKIEVRYGTYNAAQGNGILVSNGTAEVYDGVFKGDNEAGYGDGDNSGSGVASYYGFMLRGGGTLKIHGGIFEGFNGGAFVTGGNPETQNTESGTVTIQNKAEINILGGTYEALNSGKRPTTNGFSVGYNVDVTIGNAVPSENSKKIEILGFACGIAIEMNGGLNLKSNLPTKVTVQGGTAVEGQRNVNVNAIWYGNMNAELKLGECTLKVANKSNPVIGKNGGNWDDDSWNSCVWSDITPLNVYTRQADASYQKIGSAYLKDALNFNEYVITSKTLA